MKEKLQMKKKWTITRYPTNEDYLNGIIPKTIIDKNGEILPGKSVFYENVLLNEGIGELLLLLIGGTADAYNNANTYLGVGESTSTAVATQTGLSGSTLYYQAMESGYPSISAQTVTWRATFGTSDANISWQEFTVVNASSDSGKNLNRRVANQGTKTAGQTWVLDLELTIS